jgi:hypothetical protein
MSGVDCVNYFQVIGDEKELKKFYKYYFRKDRDNDIVLDPVKFLGKNVSDYYDSQGYNYPLMSPDGEFLYISTTISTDGGPAYGLFKHFVTHFPKLKFCCFSDNEFECVKQFTRIENGSICYNEDGTQIIDEEFEGHYGLKWYKDDSQEFYLKKLSPILDTPVNLRALKIQKLNRI